MLKKLFTLAATTAILGTNLAAHAIDAARSAIKSPGGTPAAGQDPKPVDGTKIQPSIPPMPPMEQAQPMPRKAPDKTVAVHKGTKATKGTKANATKSGKATKARGRTAGKGAKATHRKSRNATRQASK